MTDKDKNSRPATFVNPKTPNELWVLPRRYAPEHFVRVDEANTQDASECGGREEDPR